MKDKKNETKKGCNGARLHISQGAKTGAAFENTWGLFPPKASNHANPRTTVSVVRCIPKRLFTDNISTF
jgi:hypothetical protein